MMNMTKIKELVLDCERLVKRVERLVEADAADDVFFAALRVPKELVGISLKNAQK